MYYRVISRLFGASLIVAASASAASAVGVTIETMHFGKSDLAAAQVAYADHLSTVSRSVVFPGSYVAEIFQQYFLTANAHEP